MPEQLTAAPPSAPVADVPAHLHSAYTAALPGARATVLAKLSGALRREKLVDADRLRGDPAAFADAPAGLTVTVDGRPHTDPGALLRDLRLPGEVARLAAELDNSVHNLALARAAQPAPTGGPPALRALLSAADPLAAVEQYVVDGHPLHPCCRTRLGMSTAEVLAYAPEHRPTVSLVEVAVPAERWLSTGEGLPPRLLLHPGRPTTWRERSRSSPRPALTCPPGRSCRCARSPPSTSPASTSRPPSTCR
ncbi:IucA/IucC family protein [Luedemannella flava]